MRPPDLYTRDDQMEEVLFLHLLPILATWSSFCKNGMPTSETNSSFERGSVWVTSIAVSGNPGKYGGLDPMGTRRIGSYLIGVLDITGIGFKVLRYP